MSRAAERNSGQSLVESCIVMALICLVLMGVFQVSQLVAGREILQYAAGRGVRAKAVGFNRFMVFKTVRVGAIPNAGRMTTPEHSGGPSDQLALEEPRIPLYLAAARRAHLPAILEYERWRSIRFSEPISGIGESLHMTVKQDYPLQLPFHRVFYAGDSVEIEGESYLDSHYPLYLNDEGR